MATRRRAVGVRRPGGKRAGRRPGRAVLLGSEPDPAPRGALGDSRLRGSGSSARPDLFVAGRAVRPGAGALGGAGAGLGTGPRGPPRSAAAGVGAPAEPGAR